MGFDSLEVIECLEDGIATARPLTIIVAINGKA